MLPRQLPQKKGLALELTLWCQQVENWGIVLLQTTHLALPDAISTVMLLSPVGVWVTLPHMWQGRRPHEYQSLQR
tara:strand:+ start:2750 stop:2974 length:225 start_codon:yes stop_codon:yes gene_type:complete